MSRALVLTYHAVEAGSGPLFVDPGAFAEHLDRIVESGVRVVTVSGLAAEVRAGALNRATVAVTFDDGIASVARTAAPLLVERGLSATVFCVAGHLGARNNWSSALPGGPSLELAELAELRELAGHGFELGCHGMTHAPLDFCSGEALTREVVAAKQLLEASVEAPINTFAYPYGAMPSLAARRLVEATYASAWTTRIGYVRAGVDLFAAPRVDIHYLQRPWLLAAALSDSLGPYLRMRRLGSRARRAWRRDYVAVGEDT